MEIAVKLRAKAQTKEGAEQYCWRVTIHTIHKMFGMYFKAFADALELIPYTLAENAMVSPIKTVTELRDQHAKGNKDYGVNIRMVCSALFLHSINLTPILVEKIR